MTKTTTAVKRALLGRPRASRELRHQLLPKRAALPVFASDPLSSVAYATQEMMLVLAIAGAGSLRLVPPLSAAIVALLVIVVTSYRQTIRAYPRGGGAYIVARKNLGEAPGLIAAGALLIDYALTVAVSIAAGVAAVVAAIPALQDDVLVVAVGLLALVTFANLRGTREAGAMFAIPIYAFVAVMATLIVTGLVQCTLATCPQVPGTALPDVQATGTLTVFLLLRAFSSGAVALTGVEAISNGVPTFRYPQSVNAARTLVIMGASAAGLFLGIGYLATQTGAVAAEGMQRTVVAQVALAVFGDGLGFYLVQTVTVAIMVLAANTAYQDFPRLASILARDRFLPGQFIARGDRLVFSNGILALAIGAAALLILFGASVTSLVQLYVVGVFTAFTLSQTGMVVHWRRERSPGWRRSAVINAVGAVLTGVVVVVAASKLGGGAWIVLLAIPVAAIVMQRINHHYTDVSTRLRPDVTVVEPARPNHAVLLIDRVDEAAARALSYALTIDAKSVRALAVPAPGADIERRWAELAPDLPLRVVQPADAPRTVRALREALREDRAESGAFTTAVVAETLSASWVDQLVHHRLALRIKAALLREGDLVVADVTSPEGGPGPYTLEEPVEHHVVVLVSAMHKATARALTYAQGLRATSVRGLSVDLGLERSSRLLQAWEDWGLTMPLEIIDSPYRSITSAIRSYVRDLEPDGREKIVTCILPEFIVGRWYHQPLHNQTALMIKSALLFERGVVTVSIPYQAGRRASGQTSGQTSGRTSGRITRSRA